MTVGVLPWKHVHAFCQRPEVVLLDEAHCEISITWITAALVSQEKILRQRISLVPRVSDAFVRAGTLLGAAQCFFGKIRQRGLGSAPVHVERIWTLSEFVRVNQATARLVVGVGRQMIVDIKLSRRLGCFRECADQPMDFFLRWL